MVVFKTKPSSHVRDVARRREPLGQHDEVDLVFEHALGFRQLHAIDARRALGRPFRGWAAERLAPVSEGGWVRGSAQCEAKAAPPHLQPPNDFV